MEERKEKQKRVRANIVRYLFLILTLGVMGLIYYFSAQTGEQSSEVSNGVSGVITEILRPILPPEAVAPTEKVVRKLAHVLLFCLLGGCSSVFFATLPLPRWWFFALCAFLCSTLYAVCDEIHQLSVVGREGTVLDVLIDGVGVLFAVGVSLLCRFLRRRKKRKNQEIK